MSSRSAIAPAIAILAVVALCGVLIWSHHPERRDVALRPDPSRIHADVTAYSSSPDETWGDPFITASGRPVGDGVVACPRRLDFGTKVRIGNRIYTCWDRLHPKYDDRFDIWKSSKEEALQFGRRRVVVQIL